MWKLYILLNLIFTQFNEVTNISENWLIWNPSLIQSYGVGPKYLFFNKFPGSTDTGNLRITVLQPFFRETGLLWPRKVIFQKVPLNDKNEGLVVIHSDLECEESWCSFDFMSLQKRRMQLLWFWNMRGKLIVHLIFRLDVWV